MTSVVRPPIRLHIGGTEVREGWTILDARAGPGVDIVGDCRSLQQIADGSVQEIYAAHVVEHLGYHADLQAALGEMRRVLQPGGVARVSVPDMQVLCRMYVDPALDADQRFFIMRLLFGGQMNEHDFHKVGLDWESLSQYLRDAGFAEVSRVEEFGMFPGDCSSMRVQGKLISVNVIARKLPRLS